MVSRCSETGSVGRTFHGQHMVLIDGVLQIGAELQARGHEETILWSYNESQCFDLAVDFNQTKDGDSGDEEESLLSSKY